MAMDETDEELRRCALIAVGTIEAAIYLATNDRRWDRVEWLLGVLKKIEEGIPGSDPLSDFVLQNTTRP